METMPLAIVTVPSPLSVSVTFGPVPVPPPGTLASVDVPNIAAPKARKAFRKMLPGNLLGIFAWNWVAMLAYVFAPAIASSGDSRPVAAAGFIRQTSSPHVFFHNLKPPLQRNQFPSPSPGERAGVRRTERSGGHLLPNSTASFRLSRPVRML